MTKNQRVNLHCRIDRDLEQVIRAHLHQHGNDQWRTRPDELARAVREGLLRHYEVRDRRRR